MDRLTRNRYHWRKVDHYKLKEKVQKEEMIKVKRDLTNLQCKFQRLLSGNEELNRQRVLEEQLKVLAKRELVEANKAK